MSKKLVLIGFDLEVLELLENIQSVDIIGYVDKYDMGFENLSYLGDDKKVISENKLDDTIEVILSMDIPEVRAKLFNNYRTNISKFIAHQTSVISKRSEIGCGTIIQANTLISANVKIGDGCFLNHSASVHHESKIGDFTILAPKVLVLGRVAIGKESYIGAGAIIKQNIKIGSNVIIGAGAVVVNDIPDNTIFVGNPAKKLRNNK